MTTFCPVYSTNLLYGFRRLGTQNIWYILGRPFRVCNCFFFGAESDSSLHFWFSRETKHTGLAQHEGEYIMTEFKFCVNNPFIMLIYIICV